MIGKYESAILDYVNEKRIVSEIELLSFLHLDPKPQEGTIHTIVRPIDNSMMEVYFPFPLEVFDILRNIADQGDMIICFDILFGIPLNNLDGHYFENRVIIKKGKTITNFSKKYPSLENCVFLSREYYDNLSTEEKKRLAPFVLFGGEKLGK